MNKRRFLRTITIFLSSFILGCSSSIEVSQENAEEAAIDNSGYSANEIKNIDTEFDGSIYHISFDSPRGRFVFEVNKNGTIKSRKFEKETEIKSSDSEESINTDEKTEEKRSETNQATTESIDTDVNDNHQLETQVQQPVNDDVRDKALAIALNNVGVTSEDVSQINIISNGDTSEVSFNYGDRRITVIVNTLEERAVSTFFE